MAVQASTSTASPSHIHHSPAPHPRHHQHEQKSSSRVSLTSSKRPVRPAIKREKSGNKQKRVSIEDPEATAQEYDDMAASFPQFCTMCENQLIIPSSSVLYCSEGCRRRDMNKPLSQSAPSVHPFDSWPNTPTHSLLSFETLSPPRDIVPQRSPTAITSNRLSFTDLYSAASSDFEDDAQLFPEDASYRSRGLRHRRQESEAARYLRQFQPIGESMFKPSRRPKPQSRASTVSLEPSLSHSHSPSPGTSPSTQSGLSSLPLIYSRPLPSRVNPYSTSFGNKSISLVTPLAGPTSLPQSKSTSNLPGLRSKPSVATSVGADDLPNQLLPEELNYEKKLVVGTAPDSQSQLRSLFRFEEMQAPPTNMPT